MNVTVLVHESEAELQSAEVVVEGIEIASCLPAPTTVGTTVPVTVTVLPIPILNGTECEVIVKLEKPGELVVIEEGLTRITLFALFVMLKVNVVICPTVGFAGLSETVEALTPEQKKGFSTVTVFGLDEKEGANEFCTNT